MKRILASILFLSGVATSHSASASGWYPVLSDQQVVSVTTSEVSDIVAAAGGQVVEGSVSAKSLVFYDVVTGFLQPIGYALEHIGAKNMREHGVVYAVRFKIKNAHGRVFNAGAYLFTQAHPDTDCSVQPKTCSRLVKGLLSWNQTQPSVYDLLTWDFDYEQCRKTKDSHGCSAPANQLRADNRN